MLAIGKRFFHGLCIGFASIIPGLSGGTIIIILGIHRELIHKVSSLFTVKISTIGSATKYLFPIIIGSISGALIGVPIIARLYVSYSAELEYAFAGFILGSIPFVFFSLFTKDKTESPTPDSRKTFITILPFFVGLLLCLGLPLLTAGRASIAPDSPFVPVYLFFAATIGSALMVLPGISGSLVLVLLGLYPLMITALRELRILPLVMIVLGTLTGLFGIARLLDWCYKNYKKYINGLLFGMVCGSPWAIYINVEGNPSFPLVIISLLCMIASAVLGNYAQRHHASASYSATNLH